jgi:hypothetical protein
MEHLRLHMEDMQPRHTEVNNLDTHLHHRLGMECHHHLQGQGMGKDHPVRLERV